MEYQGRLVKALGGLLFSAQCGMAVGALAGATAGSIIPIFGTVYGGIAGLLAGFPTGLLGATLLGGRSGWMASGGLGGLGSGLLVAASLGFLSLKGHWDTANILIFSALCVLSCAGGMVAGVVTDNNLRQRHRRLFRIWAESLEASGLEELSLSQRGVALLILLGAFLALGTLILTLSNLSLRH